MARKRTSCRDFPDLTYQEAAFVIEYTKDFATRRAAEASGFNPDGGYKVLERPHVKEAVNNVITQRLDNAPVDAEWVLMEAVDNHLIARQMGNITASNTALTLIAKHTMVDALAAKKVDVDVKTDEEVMKRLARGRQRLAKEGKNVEQSDSDEVSFI